MFFGQLCQAHVTQDYEELERFLRDPHTTSEIVNEAFGYHRWTLFMLACNDGLEKVVQLLLDDFRCGVNIMDENGRNALMIACVAGQTEVVRILLNSEKIDVNYCNDHGLNALMIACDEGQVEIVCLLLDDDRIDVRTMSHFGWNALMFACRGKGPAEEVVRLLLNDDRVDVKCLDDSGHDALMIACGAGRSGAVRLLLNDDRINVNVYNNDGQNALMIACSEEEAEISLLLLEDGRTDINKKCRKNKTALVYAYESRDNLFVLRLLRYWPISTFSSHYFGLSGSDIDTPENIGRNLVKNVFLKEGFRGSKQPYLDIVIHLIHTGLLDDDVRAQEDFMTCTNSRDIVSALVHRHGDNLRAGVAVQKALWKAAEIGDVEVMRVLIDDCDADAYRPDREHCFKCTLSSKQSIHVLRLLAKSHQTGEEKERSALAVIHALGDVLPRDVLREVLLRARLTKLLW
jgi:ankyrin repeat protein